jgi:hypothetical protein
MTTANLMTCRACGCETTGVKCEVCGATALADTATLDRLTRELTAFDTFREFCEAMAGGYTPTIYPNATYGGRKLRGRVALIEAVRAAGYRVYDGERVA